MIKSTWMALLATWVCVFGGLQIANAEPHPGAETFVSQVVSEHALDPDVVRRVLSEAKYQQSIIDAMTRPAEAKPWYDYRPIFLTPTRIQGGADFWRANEDLLNSVSERFGVPIEVIVSIVGVETNYGRNTGSFRVIDALATLGFYYEPRAKFFSAELAHFMALANEESLPLTEIRGSYAGAMGLGQFIPSSYRAYAVDFDDSGHRDLWQSLPDALGSVANYLASHRWVSGEPIVLPIENVNQGVSLDGFGVLPQHTLASLSELGFEFDSQGLSPDTKATVITLETEDGPKHWVGLNNFYVITRYNRSPLYAMAVTQLSEAIARLAP